jgi:membrane-associated protein
LTALAGLQVDSAISYAVAVILPALDAIFPVPPSETAIIALGVATAGSADPRIALLIACSAAGAFLGDNLCYLLGRRFRPRVEHPFFRGEKGARRRAWAERSLEQFGMPLVVCRLIPGGWTAVTLCCGIVGYERHRFVIATAIAGMIWAAYSFLIGRLGGRAFEDKPWAGLLLAFGVTIAVSGLIEVIRRIKDPGDNRDRPVVIRASRRALLDSIQSPQVPHLVGIRLTSTCVFPVPFRWTGACHGPATASPEPCRVKRVCRPGRARISRRFGRPHFADSLVAQISACWRGARGRRRRGAQRRGTGAGRASWCADLLLCRIPGTGGQGLEPGPHARASGATRQRGAFLSGVGMPKEGACRVSP